MKPFFDDEFDAIAMAIGASGKTFKEVAGFMFPDMKVESAYARLKACCSPTGDQRLTFGQTLRLMKFCSAFQPLHYACDELLHARPDRKAPADQAARIADSIASATQTLNNALQALQRLQIAAVPTSEVEQAHHCARGGQAREVCHA